MLCIFNVFRSTIVLLTTTSYTLIATLYCSVGLIFTGYSCTELNVLGFYNMTPGSLDAYNRLISLSWPWYDIFVYNAYITLFCW